MLRPKLQQSLEEEAEEEVAAEVEVVEVVVVEEVIAEVKLKLKIRHDIQAPNIQICQLETGQGALCTSDGGKMHFSVQNHQHVLGRIFTLQNLQNKIRIEKLTSSASIVTLNEYMTFYILNKSCQKYRKIII